MSPEFWIMCFFGTIGLGLSAYIFVDWVLRESFTLDEKENDEAN